MLDVIRRERAAPLSECFSISYVRAQSASAATSVDIAPAEEAQLLKNTETFVRELFAWGSDYKVKAGPVVIWGNFAGPGRICRPGALGHGGRECGRLFRDSRLVMWCAGCGRQFVFYVLLQRGFVGGSYGMAVYEDGGGAVDA
jgi:hypothetical protein